MILVTGGTGFIGQALIRHLSEMGYPVRILIRPSPQSPKLPFGIPVEAVVSSLSDERSLRAAMVGVDTVYHLASGERSGVRASLIDIDVQGTRNVVQTAADAGVKRLFFMSHLGADRASAFALLKAKGIAEEFVRRSGLDYTIIRSAIVFGPNDGFTTGLARLLSVSPGIFLVPGDGKVLLQPFWVEDLVTCLTWSLEDEQTRNQTIEVGGPEYLNLRNVLELVMGATSQRRRVVGIFPPYLRGLTIFLEATFPGMPVSVYWLDILAANRTCALDTAPRTFSLIPSRMSQRLDYLQKQNWRKGITRRLLRGM